MKQHLKKLLDRVREIIRRKRYSFRTEKSYVAWNLLILLSNYSISRQEVFDVVFVATLIDNGVDGITTRNANRFSKFEFLEILNPLE